MTAINQEWEKFSWLEVQELREFWDFYDPEPFFLSFQLDLVSAISQPMVALSPQRVLWVDCLWAHMPGTQDIIKRPNELVSV